MFKLSDARDLAFVVAIYLYFAGFCFRQSYYDEFGLPQSIDPVDLFATFTYSFKVLSLGAATLVEAFICWAVLSFALRQAALRYEALVIIRRWFPVMTLLGLLLVVYNVSAKTGKQFAVQFMQRRGVDYAATIELKPDAYRDFDASQNSMQSAALNDLHVSRGVLAKNGLLQLLAATDKSYIFSAPIEGEYQGCSVGVFIVPRDAVNAMKINIPVPEPVAREQQELLSSNAVCGN